MDPRPTCSHTRRDGSPCRASALPGKDVCLFHDPSSAAARANGRKKGGARAHQPPAVLAGDVPDRELRTVGQVCEFLGVIANRTVKGELDARVANAATYTLTSLAAALAKSDLESRLLALEERQAAIARGEV
jgi:hypothetical protein